MTFDEQDEMEEMLKRAHMEGRGAIKVEVFELLKDPNITLESLRKKIEKL